MPSDRRLHPLSIVFSVGGQIRSLALPLLLLLVGATSAGWEWQKWLLVLLIPYTLVAVGRYVSFRYRYEAHEMVIRSGLLFRNERHVPYARIQNLDAVRNVFHRLLGVVEVRVQTGSGHEPEATMSVLPLAAYEEMRRRVFSAAGAGAVGFTATTPATPATAATTAAASTAGGPASTTAMAEGAADAVTAGPASRASLLALTPRELMLSGLVENRGFVVVAAVFGLLWELGLWDGITDRAFGEQALGRGVARDAARAIFDDGPIPWERIAVALFAFAGFLVLVRLLSMGWALVRLHGFRLTRADLDLRTEFGLLTHVVTTIPMHRIQTLTIREGPLHRWFGRASVRVDTAGGEGGEDSTTQREQLAPIIRRDALPGLLREVLPGLDLASLAWQAPAPRAFGRAFRKWLIVAGLLSLALAVPLGWRTLVVPAVVVPWGWLDARRSVARQAWALTDGVIVFRSGWIWWRLTIARLGKLQVVALHESPFDRRAAMASVRVDTAGAGDASHRVDIPYMPREAARDLCAVLASRAARIAFRW